MYVDFLFLQRNDSEQPRKVVEKKSRFLIAHMIQKVHRLSKFLV